MYRRTLLAAAGTALVGALAGCTGSGDDGTETEPGGGSTTTTGDHSTPTDEPTDSGEHPVTETSRGELTDSTFTVTRNQCGTQGYEASIAFDAGAGTVTLTGTIDGSDSCKTAVLTDATVDDSTGDLSVVVGTADDCAETEMGAQCIVEIDYEATFSFAEALPGRVVVTHDGASGRQQVASARP